MKQTRSIQLMLFLLACMMLALGIVATTDSVYAQSPAYAPTQTACDSHETSLLDWNDTLVLPAFDPSLGTLTSVDLTASIQITTTFLLRNLNALDNTIFGAYDAELSVLLPDGSFLSVDATASVTETLPGATDPFNPPEITVNGAPIASADVIQYTPFADFVGGPGTMISFTTAANSEDLQLSSLEGSQGGDAFSFGEAELCVTYTYEPYGSIGDTIYHDADASGTQESGEPGLPGVVVSLDDGMGNVITATTTITGFYQFDMLPMGTYTVTVDTTNVPGQKELVPSDDPEGDGDVVSTTTLAVDDPGTADDEANDPTQDFGFRPLVPGVEIVKTAGDAADGGVYMTAAGDVLYTFVVTNTGETHLSDLVIVDDLGTAAAADDETLTSAECVGLAGPLAPNDTVTCTLTLPVSEDTTNVAGVTGTPTTPGGDPLPDVDDPMDDDDAVVEILTPGIEIVKTAGDAADGDVLTTAPGDVVYTYVITNTGNTNLADVTVVDDAGTPTDSGDDVTIDGAICAALMAVLAPGESVTCTATLTVNADTTNVADVTGLPVDDGGDPLPNVDPPMDDDPAEVVIILGQIGDLIFHDANNDGMYDPADGDMPLENVVVTLTDADGNDTIQTTDGNGYYLFDNLPMGDYTITVDTRTIPMEKVVVPSADPENDGDSTSDVRLTENDPADLDQDFGYRPIEGSLGDTIFHDIDGNGVYNISEGDFPLPGVDVILEDEDGMTQTVTTDANGFYLFTDLPLGTYTVTVDADTVPTDKVDDPTADPDNDNDETSTTTLTPDEPSDPTLDFGYEPVLGSVGDLIFHDADGDGMFDAADGDFPLADVLVVLTDEDGNEMTTTTDGSGNYLFDMLPLGAYTVTVDVRTLTIDKVTDPTADPENDGDNSSETVLTEDAPDDMMQDFGYQPGAGSIGDTIFHDANGDGVYDADDGDFPLPGVVMTLTTASGDTITETTGADGTYEFTNLPFGDYTVTVDETTLPEDKVGEPSADPEDDGDNSSSVSLSPTEPTNDDQDFGYEPILSSIGDTVWFDLDGNGEQDTGELGIENVTVVLTDEDGNQTVDFTDSDGMYLFDGLTAGTYTVTVIPSSLPLNDPLIALISQTYDADGLGTPDQSVYELGEAEDDRDQDFGYQPSPPQGSIGGTIYNDPDGIPMNEDDALIADGVVVKLLNEAGEVIATAVTQDGVYLFPNLPLGAYSVEVDTTTIPETKVGDTSTYPDPLAIVLSEAEPLDVDNDFGYPTTVASIGDTIFHDADGDGVYEPDDGDRPLPNVIVILTDENGDETLETTDEDGMYLFDELVFGTYTVTVDTRTLPEDKVDDTPTADPEDDGDSTATTTVDSTTPNDLDQDFGYGPVLGSIGDTIFHDVDGDGVFNPDSVDMPLPNVFVVLTDAMGNMITKTTDSNGRYLFDNLPLGDYTITVDEVTLPNDKSSVPSADPENDGDNNSSVSLTADMPNNLDQDYGYQSPEVEELRGSIGNFVFYDFDGNGLNPPVDGSSLDFDPAKDLPLPNVFVQLIDADGNIETTVTDASGHYKFDDLPMGAYTVTVVNTTVVSPYDPLDQVALDITYDPTGAADGVSTTTLTPDAPDVVDQDFGYWREPKPTSVNLVDLTTQSWSLALVAITMTTLLTAVTGWAAVKRNS